MSEKPSFDSWSDWSNSPPEARPGANASEEHLGSMWGEVLVLVLSALAALQVLLQRGVRTQVQPASSAVAATGRARLPRPPQVPAVALSLRGASAVSSERLIQVYHCTSRPCAEAILKHGFRFPSLEEAWGRGLKLGAAVYAGTDLGRCREEALDALERTGEPRDLSKLVALELTVRLDAAVVSVGDYCMIQDGFEDELPGFPGVTPYEQVPREVAERIGNGFFFSVPGSSGEAQPRGMTMQEMEEWTVRLCCRNLASETGCAGSVLTINRYCPDTGVLDLLDDGIIEVALYDAKHIVNMRLVDG